MARRERTVSPDRADLKLVGAHGVERLGRLYVDRWPDQIRLVDISLTPEFRGRGIGRMLMEGILAEGRTSGKRVTIHVDTTTRCGAGMTGSDFNTSTPTASIT